jgi:hypothetical protein
MRAKRRAFIREHLDWDAGKLADEMQRIGLYARSSYIKDIVGWVATIKAEESR